MRLRAGRPMPADRPRTPRTLLIPDHLWDASAARPAKHANDVGVDGRLLVLYAKGRELDRVTKDRFIIGRGKHYDLIISSGKVSREHAAIVRNGTEYFIEHLGSSNGTWHDKRRINRRQIRNGDGYYICSEKLSCVFQ